MNRDNPVFGTELLPPTLDLSPARRRLFETAIVLFGDRGFHGVSVRDITDALGQHKGALYGHATSKQDLLFQLVYIGFREHLRVVTQACEEAPPDPTSQMRAMVSAHVLSHLRYPAASRVCTREVRALSDEHRAAVAAVRAETHDLSIRIIEDGRREGAFAVKDAQLAALAIAGMGIRTAEWWDDRGPDAEYIAETYVRYALLLVEAQDV